MHEWLVGFETAAVGEMLDLEPQLQEDQEVFAKLVDACSDGNVLGNWTVSTFGGQGGSPDHLNLMTLHSSKGLEFDVVFMLGMEPPHQNSWVNSGSGRSPSW